MLARVVRKNKTINIESADKKSGKNASLIYKFSLTEKISYSKIVPSCEPRLLASNFCYTSVVNRKKSSVDIEQRTYKGKFVHKIPWPRVQPLGFVFMDNIFLRDALWEDYLTGSPSPKTLSILSHEHTHTKRLGRNIKSNVVYWLKRDYRFREELAAIESEMNVLKQYGEDFDIDKRAGNLSGIPYLWCTDYETARSELDSLWKSE